MSFAKVRVLVEDAGVSRRIVVASDRTGWVGTPAVRAQQFGESG
jgi:hypothetical protein